MVKIGVVVFADTETPEAPGLVVNTLEIARKT